MESVVRPRRVRIDVVERQLGESALVAAVGPDQVRADRKDGVVGRVGEGSSQLGLMRELLLNQGEAPVQGYAT
jgi:hypothetical protein